MIRECAECGEGECPRCRRNRLKRERRRLQGGVRPFPVRKVDAEHTRCPSCAEVKANSEFSTEPRRWDGLAWACRPCTNTARKDRGVKDRDAYRRAHRKNQLQKYGLTPETYEALCAAQDGRCAICLDPVERLHVDHNHTTGAVRGLLCQPCNIGIGNFRDRVDLLLKAADYVVADRDLSQTGART